MVDFNAWKCRNCDHWHPVADKILYFGEKLLPNEHCNHKYLRANDRCHCDHWESANNLVYLEQLYEKKKTTKSL